MALGSACDTTQRSKKLPDPCRESYTVPLAVFLLYQRVGARKKNSRHHEAERAGRFKINDEFEFLRRLNGRVRWSGALADPVCVIGHQSEQAQDIDSVGH